jgi:hypothetical protein
MHIDTKMELEKERQDIGSDISHIDSSGENLSVPKMGYLI